MRLVWPYSQSMKNMTPKQIAAVIQASITSSLAMALATQPDLTKMSVEDYAGLVKAMACNAAQALMADDDEDAS